VNWIKQNNYEKSEHILPHDVEVRELGTGKSRREILQSLGLSITVAPKLSVDDGIQAVRQMLPNCYFHPRVKQGLDCLRNYRRQYDEKRNVYYDKPLHDWSSHGSDAARYLAVGMNTDSSWSKPLPQNIKWIV
jgi:phage terminase large subunit